eukprot:gene15740-biopygen5214
MAKVPAAARPTAPAERVGKSGRLTQFGHGEARFRQPAQCEVATPPFRCIPQPQPQPQPAEGETTLPVSGRRPVCARFFGLIRAARVRSVSGPCPLSFVPAVAESLPPKNEEVPAHKRTAESTFADVCPAKGGRRCTSDADVFNSMEASRQFRCRARCDGRTHGAQLHEPAVWDRGKD